MAQAPRRILMLVENYYPQDTRVRNEATLLAGAGYRVSVVAWRKPNQVTREDVNGVQVYRVSPWELFQKTPSPDAGFFSRIWLKLVSILGYMVEYGYFTSSCFWVSLKIFVTEGFDVIHAHNPPDTLFLAALPFKLLGKKFVFDHHDLCPELYCSRYGAAKGLTTSVLGLFEWFSLKTADVTIATNESYKQIQMERGGRRSDSVFVVRNGPDATRMNPVAPNPALLAMNKTILCYVGALNPQDGVDYLLRALAKLCFELKRTDFYCVIMGSGDSLEDLRSLSRQLRLEAMLELTGFISEDALRANLAAADICVDPDPSSPLNDVSTWIKIMEYMANSKPIVTFDLKETHFSAQEAALYVAPNDELAFAKAIAVLMDQPERRKEMGEAGRRRVEQHLQWKVVGTNLLEAYKKLFGQPPLAMAETAPKTASESTTSAGKN